MIMMMIMMTNPKRRKSGGPLQPVKRDKSEGTLELDVEGKDVQAKAKSKSKEPSGEKRKSDRDIARSPGKAKMQESTGEKRKVDSDVDEPLLQGSPMKAKLNSIEVCTCSKIHVLKLHKSSRLTEDQEKHNIHTMDLGDLRIDDLDNRAKVTAWVREMKPACIIGSAKGRSGDHISWCCSLYKLQVGEGRTFVHEHSLGSPDKCVREVGQSRDFGPSTVVPLLTLSSESTREAETQGFQVLP